MASMLLRILTHDCLVRYWGMAYARVRDFDAKGGRSEFAGGVGTRRCC
jgi:hypothetical protein